MKSKQTQTELHTVPASESSVLILAHPSSCFGLLMSSSWLSLQDMLTEMYNKINWSTVVHLRLTLEIFSSRCGVKRLAPSVSGGSSIPSFPSPGSLPSRLLSVVVDNQYFSMYSIAAAASLVTCSDRPRQQAYGSAVRNGRRDSHGTTIGVSVSCRWCRRSRCRRWSWRAPAPGLSRALVEVMIPPV